MYTSISWVADELPASEALVELYWLGKKPKYCKGNLSQCHCVHYKFHTNWPGIEPRPPRWEACDWPPGPWHNYLFMYLFMLTFTLQTARNTDWSRSQLTKTLSCMMMIIWSYARQFVKRYPQQHFSFCTQHAGCHFEQFFEYSKPVNWLLGQPAYKEVTCQFDLIRCYIWSYWANPREPPETVRPEGRTLDLLNTKQACQPLYRDVYKCWSL